MENNFNDSPSTCFANPKPVKKEENPGVLLIIDGKFIPADKFIFSSAVSTYLALKWVEDLLKENRRLESSIKEALAALPVALLAEYVQEMEESRPNDYADEEN